MWILQRLIGKTESFEAKSQLDNQQQHPDLRLQTDRSIDGDKLVQVLSQDIKNLVLSSQDEVIDRYIQGHAVVIHEEDQGKQATDEDLGHLFMKEAVNETLQTESANESEEKNHQDVSQLMDETVERQRLEQDIKVDQKECRVLEERETGESEIGCENQEEEVDDVIVYEHKNWDLKEKHEIEIDEEDSSSEIRGYEDNSEQRWSKDGNYRQYEYAEDLENESENVGGDGWEEGSAKAQDDDKLKAYHHPLRLDAGDCSYYIRTGICKFGSACKFNHPIRRINQPTKETKKQKVERRGRFEGKPTKETKKQKEEKVERHERIECKYHTSSAGCKHGKACKFNHGRGKTVKTQVVQYNFVGLPIRPGEKECPYYMRNGSCKYGLNCRFNHPDPTAVVGNDAPTTYGNDGPLPLQPAPRPNIPNITSRSAPRTPDHTTAFVPMMCSPNQNMPPPKSDWNSYQAPAHLHPNSEQALPEPPAFFLNNPPSDTNMYTHHQQTTLISEYPERPGQPDCSHFMKTGDCKYRASCKFHHPRSRITSTLRDQKMCAYFSRHGTCKYGKACKYDHPVKL